jgi:hypothetical protein
VDIPESDRLGKLALTIKLLTYSGPIWFVNRESEINGIMKSQKREEK